jgi:cytochrome c553
MSVNFRCTLIYLILPGLLLLSGVFVQAQEGDINSLLSYVEKRLNDEGARQKAIEDGQDRALLCQYCHGSDGNSLQPDVPNLAGQNAKYLLEQIHKFATRERDDFVMSELAANFSPEDKVNVAIFYHAQSVKPQKVDEKKAAMGQKLYHSVCSACHGIEGYGNHKLARLAGQKVVYVMNVLNNFRNNANNPAARKEAQRTSEIMEGVVKSLSDEQIEAVANYVASMP